MNNFEQLRTSPMSRKNRLDTSILVLWIHWGSRSNPGRKRDGRKLDPSRHMRSGSAKVETAGMLFRELAAVSRAATAICLDWSRPPQKSLTVLQPLVLIGSLRPKQASDAPALALAELPEVACAGQRQCGQGPVATHRQLHGACIKAPPGI